MQAPAILNKTGMPSAKNVQVQVQRGAVGRYSDEITLVPEIETAQQYGLLSSTLSSRVSFSGHLISVLVARAHG